LTNKNRSKKCKNNDKTNVGTRQQQQINTTATCGIQVLWAYKRNFFMQLIQFESNFWAEWYWRLGKGRWEDGEMVGC